MCENLIIYYFDPNKQYFIEIDFSDYVNAGMLSQMGENGLLHPVTYFSRRMAPVKCHYEIYDKELLAIIWCFKEWQPELEGTSLPVKVFTDHKGLEYFMSTKKLTLKQIRWAEFLLKFNFVISYQSDKKSNKVNALTRKPNEQPTDNEDKRRKHSVRVLLPPDRIDYEAELQPIKEDHADRTDSDTNSNASDKTSPLLEQVIESNQNNELCSKIRLYLANPRGLKKPEVYLKGLRVENGLLMKGNWLYITDKDQLQLKVIKEIHNQLAVGHLGTEWTLEMARRHYY